MSTHRHELLLPEEVEGYEQGYEQGRSQDSSHYDARQSRYSQSTCEGESQVRRCVRGKQTEAREPRWSFTWSVCDLFLGYVSPLQGEVVRVEGRQQLKRSVFTKVVGHHL